MADEAQGSETVPDPERLDLYRYATAENASEYLTIMRLFTETLLTDLSGSEIAEQLAARGLALEFDEVETRCRQLERWGNLVRSVRDARVATVADHLRARSRFQMSKLGGRVQRQIDEVLQATAGVRDVARELLGGMVETLDRILERLGHPEERIDADALAGDVTTVFSSQRLFTESVRDFYAYLHQVLSRYDLAGDEYGRFKELLLSYVDLITADVARHAPAVSERLARLQPYLGRLLEILERLPTLTNADGSRAERQPGRQLGDWVEFADWYADGSDHSGPDQLRRAAGQALGQLLANAKRMLAAAGTGVSRRGDLLRLAQWFACADDAQAHRLFAAAFGAHPSRHLLGGPDEDSPRQGALTSWWEADPVAVPVSLRERGERTARGKASRVPDPGLDREELLSEARAQHERELAAAAELVAAGRLDGARISAAARAVLLDRLGGLLAVSGGEPPPLEWFESDLGFLLRAGATSGATTVHCDDGQLVIHGLALEVEPLEVETAEARDARDEPEVRATGTRG